MTTTPEQMVSALRTAADLIAEVGLDVLRAEAVRTYDTKTFAHGAAAQLHVDAVGVFSVAVLIGEPVTVRAAAGKARYEVRGEWSGMPVEVSAALELTDLSAAALLELLRPGVAA